MSCTFYEKPGLPTQLLLFLHGDSTIAALPDPLLYYHMFIHSQWNTDCWEIATWIMQTDLK